MQIWLGSRLCKTPNSAKGKGRICDEHSSENARRAVGLGSLAGKVSLVTGSTSASGSEIGRALAEAGSAVVLKRPRRWLRDRQDQDQISADYDVKVSYSPA